VAEPAIPDGDDGLLQQRSAHGLKRAHNFVEGEPITSALTVRRDLGKRRCAQRFLVVPWSGWGRRFDSGGGLHMGSDQRKRWSSWRSMRPLPSREHIPVWDAIRLDGSSSDPVDTSNQRRCLTPCHFHRVHGRHSGPRTHPWTTSKGRMAGRPVPPKRAPA